MSTLNLSCETENPEWKHLVGNYQDFQNELNNASEGIEFLKQLWTDFHLFEVYLSKNRPRVISRGDFRFSAFRMGPAASGREDRP